MRLTWYAGWMGRLTRNLVGQASRPAGKSRVPVCLGSASFSAIRSNTPHAVVIIYYCVFLVFTTLELRMLAVRLQGGAEEEEEAEETSGAVSSSLPPSVAAPQANKVADLMADLMVDPAPAVAGSTAAAPAPAQAAPAVDLLGDLLGLDTTPAVRTSSDTAALYGARWSLAS